MKGQEGQERKYQGGKQKERTVNGRTGKDGMERSGKERKERKVGNEMKGKGRKGHETYGGKGK